MNPQLFTRVPFLCFELFLVHFPQNLGNFALSNFQKFGFQIFQNLLFSWNEVWMSSRPYISLTNEIWTNLYLNKRQLKFHRNLRSNFQKSKLNNFKIAIFLILKFLVFQNPISAFGCKVWPTIPFYRDPILSRMDVKLFRYQNPILSKSHFRGEAALRSWDSHWVPKYYVFKEIDIYKDGFLWRDRDWQMEYFPAKHNRYDNSSCRGSLKLKFGGLLVLMSWWDMLYEARLYLFWKKTTGFERFARRSKYNN